MTGTITNRLRDALNEVADEIPAGSVPMLRLPDAAQHELPRHISLRSPGATPGARRLRAAPGDGARDGAGRDRHDRPDTWTRRLLVPLGAAAAVAVAVAAVTTAAALAGHPRPAKPGPARPGPAGPAAVANPRAQVPPFYVTLAGTSGGGPHVNPLAHPAAELRATATGAVLGSIGAPRGYQGYVAVSAAASDRSFVLAAQTPLVPVHGHGPQTLGERTKFYLLTIDPAARTAERRLRLTALPIPVLPPWDVYQKLALSPDGSRLAVLLGTPQAGDFPAAQQLSVYNLATGAVRSRVIYSLNFPMSWQSDSRTLGVVGSLQPLRTHPQGWSPRYSYLLIDTAAPGSGLTGRATFPVANSLHLRWYAATLTADGRTVIGSVNDNPSAKWAPAVTDNPGYDLLVAYNARTGRREVVIRRLPTAPGGTGLNTSYVLWSDSSGRVLVIVTGPYRKHPQAGIYSGGRFIPLPIASGTSPSDSAW